MVLQEKHSLTTDIWAVGIFAYECLVGEVPWSGGVLEGRMSNISNEYLRGQIGKIIYPEDLPQIAKNFIQTCLRFDQKTRPTARQLMSHPFLSKNNQQLPDVVIGTKIPIGSVFTPKGATRPKGTPLPAAIRYLPQMDNKDKAFDFTDTESRNGESSHVTTLPSISSIFGSGSST